MSTTRRRYTDEELMALPSDGCKRELVDGEIVVMSPAGTSHGRVVMRLAAPLQAWADEHDLGDVYCSSTGFWLDADNMRSPDVSFLTRARRPPDDHRGFGPEPPDLAVEVLSPRDSERHVLDKVGAYLAAGTRLVWIVDPEKRRAVVHRSLTDARSLGEDDELDGEDVVPGFRCRLGDIFG
jgi:Uma2 family endonuclease